MAVCNLAGGLGDVVVEGSADVVEVAEDEGPVEVEPDREAFCCANVCVCSALSSCVNNNSSSSRWISV